MAFKLKKFSPETGRSFYVCSSGGTYYLSQMDPPAVFASEDEARKVVRLFGPDEQHIRNPFTLEDVAAAAAAPLAIDPRRPQ